MHENRRAVMPQRHERVFLVRMWRNGDGADAVWRGRVHDVATGKRFYVTPAEVGGFIAESLGAAADMEPPVGGDTATSGNAGDVRS